jgi:hypothetical protein
MMAQEGKSFQIWDVIAVAPYAFDQTRFKEKETN